MHGYFKRALAARIDQIGEKGVPSELDLAPQETTQSLAEGTSEDYWDVMAPNGKEAFLQRLCEAIWFFHLIDEGDSNKKFKSAAALRKVPVHDELLRLGLLEYRSRMEAQRKPRMFPEYTYCAKNGYGRALGRWFNITLTPALGILTPALGIKSTGHVFHGLRHTMVTRLAQAGVQNQFISPSSGTSGKPLPSRCTCERDTR